jgi:hypothetical protein
VRNHLLSGSILEKLPLFLDDYLADEYPLLTFSLATTWATSRTIHNDCQAAFSPISGINGLSKIKANPFSLPPHVEINSDCFLSNLHFHVRWPLLVQLCSAALKKLNIPGSVVKGYSKKLFLPSTATSPHLQTPL